MNYYYSLGIEMMDPCKISQDWIGMIIIIYMWLWMIMVLIIQVQREAKERNDTPAECEWETDCYEQAVDGREREIAGAGVAFDT